MDALAASTSSASPDGPWVVILGIAVVLVFVAIVVRGLWRCTRGPRPAARRALAERPTAAEPFAGAEVSRPSDWPDEPSIALADAPEPELTRLDHSTLVPLGRTLDRSKRFRAAEDRVARELDTLAYEFWLVERYVVVGARRIPFLVAGATGVFVISATDGAWTMFDLDVLSDSADDVRSQLIGYDGPVHPVMCLAFDQMTPRTWYGGSAQDGHGGWVLGLDWLKKWMFSLGPQHGLRNGDVRHLREDSGPFWERRSTARLPQTPNLG
jgi:hypothetical protein